MCSARRPPFRALLHLSHCSLHPRPCPCSIPSSAFPRRTRYDPVDGPPLDYPLRGGDKSAPEHREPRDSRVNPFPTDVYYLGNLIREHFIQKRFGFDFIVPLVGDMVLEDPDKRPTIDEVVFRFQGIRTSLSSWKMRSRIVGRGEISVVRAWRACGWSYRTLRYVLTRKPAIPDQTSWKGS
ncbi:hypothetical protein FA95DRAFT_1033844 [Auriscalpium vulgare]|uniref:Uncharacterized protein n=1 Tax=Auriscalpium vulgare TaxID=40419 RepID=A0ACB8RY45_9AGAM|nr:hypothetical protein FA95DRAFT_1033844 [Auriscalpium vulgare]